MMLLTRNGTVLWQSALHTIVARGMDRAAVPMPAAFTHAALPILLEVAAHKLWGLIWREGVFAFD
jgi:hypothetical protein